MLPEEDLARERDFYLCEGARGHLYILGRGLFIIKNENQKRSDVTVHFQRVINCSVPSHLSRINRFDPIHYSACSLSAEKKIYIYVYIHAHINGVCF